MVEAGVTIIMAEKMETGGEGDDEDPTGDISVDDIDEDALIGAIVGLGTSNNAGVAGSGGLVVDDDEESIVDDFLRSAASRKPEAAAAITTATVVHGATFSLKNRPGLDIITVPAVAAATSGTKLHKSNSFSSDCSGPVGGGGGGMQQCRLKHYSSSCGITPSSKKGKVSSTVLIKVNCWI